MSCPVNPGLGGRRRKPFRHGAHEPGDGRGRLAAVHDERAHPPPTPHPLTPPPPPLPSPPPTITISSLVSCVDWAKCPTSACVCVCVCVCVRVCVCVCQPANDIDLFSPLIHPHGVKETVSRDEHLLFFSQNLSCSMHKLLTSVMWRVVVCD